MKPPVVACLLLLTLFSCSSRKQVILEFDNIQGLKEGSSVFFNGLEIGRVNSFKIGRNNAILVITELDKLSQIPRDSRFTIVNSSLLNDKVIEVDPGTSERCLQANDTIKGGLEEDISGAAILKSIINLVDSNSVTTELDRLNDNLEKLLEQRE